MQENAVLIVSDRPDRASLLVRAVERVIPCCRIDATGALPPERPLVALVDVTQDEAGAAWVARLYGLRIPSLHLTNRAPPGTAKSAAVNRSLPADTPRTVVLAALFGLIDAQQAARARLPAGSRRVEAAVHRANAIVCDVFESAQSGRPVSVSEVDAGTDAILDAVSECGIRTWLEIIARYDQQLYQHSLSVAGYAVAFGASLKLARADQMRLARAALLHDVGKAKIPLAILNKPGRLTPEETAVMRTHPAIGADLLAGQGGFDDAMLGVVRHHHEMLDGSGYPDGLAGSAVPDLVRLVTICDIHSALTERRAYRDPLPHADAYAIMQGMGLKLDGDLLRAFRSTVIGSAADAPVG